MPTTLLVIENSVQKHLAVLDKLPSSVRIIESADPELLMREAPNADIILNGNFRGQPFDRVFPLAKQVQWVHSLSTGVEGILTPELLASPVPLTNGRGVFRGSLAEWGLAAMLYFAKGLRQLIGNQQAGVWKQFDVLELCGQTLGIIGYGGIGQATAQRAHAFGMRVIAVRRNPENSNGDPILDRVYGPSQIHEMLPECDVVFLATPNTPETQGLMGERELALMKKTAIIVNVGRGSAIDEPALIRALENRTIHGAALDVFVKEPLPEGHPFYRLENVLLSPHSADHLPGWIDMAGEVFWDNFQRFSNGEPLINVVDKKAGY